jgi:hypothetical protein
MDHIEKLVKYREKIRELHQVSNESGVKTDIVAFDKVDIKITDTAIVTTHWSNNDNCVTKTRTFPLAMIDSFIETVEEKIKYRKKVISGKNENEEGK